MTYKVWLLLRGIVFFLDNEAVRSVKGVKDKITCKKKNHD